MQIRIYLSLITVILAVISSVSCSGQAHRADLQGAAGTPDRIGSTTVAPTLVDYDAEDWNMYGFRFRNRRAGMDGPECGSNIDVEGTVSSWTLPEKVSASPTSVIAEPGTANEDIGFFITTESGRLYFIEGMAGTPVSIYGNSTVPGYFFASSPAIDNEGNVFFLTMEYLGGGYSSALRVYVPSTSTVYSAAISMTSPANPFRQMGSPIIVNDAQSANTEVYVGTLTDDSNWYSTLYRFDFDRTGNSLSQTWSRTVNGYVTGPAAYLDEGDGFVGFVAAQIVAPSGTLLYAVATDNSVLVTETIAESPIRDLANSLNTNYAVVCTQYLGMQDELDLLAVATNLSRVGGLRGQIHFYDLELDTSVRPPAWVLTETGTFSDSESYWISGPAAGSGAVYYAFTDPSDSIYINRADGHVSCVDSGVYQEDTGWDLGYTANRPLALLDDAVAGTHFGYSAEGQTCTVGRADDDTVTTDAVFTPVPSAGVTGVPMCSVNGNAYVPAAEQDQQTLLWTTELWQFTNP